MNPMGVEERRAQKREYARKRYQQNAEVRKRQSCRQREKYARDPKTRERLKTHAALYYNTLEGRCRAAITNARTSARRLGHAPCVSTWEEVRDALVAQNYCCKVTGVPEAFLNRKLCMDHCHETGEFRGWICNEANCILGYAKESLEFLSSVTAYLGVHKNENS